MANKTYAIHPAIGIARMGNAPFTVGDESSYFLSPEAPHEVANEGKAYKIDGKIKKQAQRFRIYEFEDGKATREVTLTEDDVQTITWRVTLANRKAALDTSEKGAGTIAQPTYRPPDFWPAVTRNAAGGIDPNDKGHMCIRPATQSVAPGDGLLTMAGEVAFEQQTAVNTLVVLGQAASEPSTGRLLLFAGDGLSQGVLKGTFSQHAKFGNAENAEVFTNSDNWYDQSADGRVEATITFSDGTTVELSDPEQAAWAICAVPAYAPGIGYYTDLYDVAVDAKRKADADGPVSFKRDIFPILQSVSLLQWVSAKGALGHGSGKLGNYLTKERLRLVSNNNPDSQSDPYIARNAVFARLRNPNNLPKRPFRDLTKTIVGMKQMPQVPDDVINQALAGHDWALPSVTPLQYERLRRWRDGDFEADGLPEYTPLESLPVSDQPDALDRGALKGSSGTPFYPGIESWNVMQLSEMYAAPLRLKSDVMPGDLTMGNAIPWQADFYDCTESWWPVQRPTEVWRDGKPGQSWTPAAWAESKVENFVFEQMVLQWWRLGFIVSNDGGLTFEETERNVLPYDHED